MDACRPIRRFSLISLAVAGATLLAAAAPAQTPDVRELHAVKVKYGDLNLASTAGATKLYYRIQGAARFVCGEEGRGLDEQRVWNECFHTSVTEAVIAVHSPLLSTLDRGAGIKSTPTARLTH
jgi:UrcA family protein